MFVAFSHKNEYTYVNQTNQKCFLGNHRGLPPFLQDIKLEMADKRGDYRLYENFWLNGLDEKVINQSKRQYISYLKSQKYLRQIIKNKLKIKSFKILEILFTPPPRVMRTFFYIFN